MDDGGQGQQPREKLLLTGPQELSAVELIAMRAAGIIAVHNHPSGNVRPSRSDRELTKNLQWAGKMLDCPLLDHLIVSRNRYFSFADEGEL